MLDTALVQLSELAPMGVGPFLQKWVEFAVRTPLKNMPRLYDSLTNFNFPSDQDRLIAIRTTLRVVADRANMTYQDVFAKYVDTAKSLDDVFVDAKLPTLHRPLTIKQLLEFSPKVSTYQNRQAKRVFEKPYSDHEIPGPPKKIRHP